VSHIILCQGIFEDNPGESSLPLTLFYWIILFRDTSMGFMMIPAESYRILTWIISMHASRTASNPAWRTLPVDQFINRTDPSPPARRSVRGAPRPVPHHAHADSGARVSESLDLNIGYVPDLQTRLNMHSLRQRCQDS